MPANSVGAWLGLAFVLGALARSIPTAAIKGLVGLLSAVGAYYLLIGVLGEGFRAIGASHAASVWGAVALLAGPVMGAAGGLWRHRRGWPRAIAVGLLASALLAEGIGFGLARWAHLEQLPSDPGAVILVVEAALGLALPFVLLPAGERFRGYVAAAAIGLVGAAAIGPVTDLLRSIADRF